MKYPKEIQKALKEESLQIDNKSFPELIKYILTTEKKLETILNKEIGFYTKRKYTSITEEYIWEKMKTFDIMLISIQKLVSFDEIKSEGKNLHGDKLREIKDRHSNIMLLLDQTYIYAKAIENVRKDLFSTHANFALQNEAKNVGYMRNAKYKTDNYPTKYMKPMQINKYN